MKYLPIYINTSKYSENIFVNRNRGKNITFLKLIVFKKNIYSLLNRNALFVTIYDGKKIRSLRIDSENERMNVLLFLSKTIYTYLNTLQNWREKVYTFIYHLKESKMINSKKPGNFNA